MGRFCAEKEGRKGKGLGILFLRTPVFKKDFPHHRSRDPKGREEGEHPIIFRRSRIEKRERGKGGSFNSEYNLR